jgi:hypothetical protein
MKASFADGLIAVPMNMIGIIRANDASGKGRAFAKGVLNVFAAFADVGVDARRHVQQGYLADSAVVHEGSDTSAFAGRSKRRNSGGCIRCSR